LAKEAERKRRHQWGLSLPTEWYKDLVFAGYLQVVDIYHFALLPRDFMAVRAIAHRAVNVDVIRHRLPTNYSHPYTLGFAPRLEISFVNVSWRHSRYGIILPVASETATTAIIHFRFSPYLGLHTDFSVKWQIGSRVSHLVIIWAKTENHPMDINHEPESTSVQHSIAMCRQLLSLIKKAVIDRNIRLTIVGVESWKEIDAKEVARPIRQSFLELVESIVSAWPDNVDKSWVIENLRFLYLENWRREVGEEMFRLATVE
jgi:hypothetical protein